MPILVHEFFHSLTDVVDYKKELILDKNKLDYIQETVSILAEFICAKYLEDAYQTEMQNLLLARIYSGIYIDCQSAVILMKYLNAVMSGLSLEELKKNFYIEELREVIQNRKKAFAMNHFIGTMVSITKIQNMKDSLKLLKYVVEKIENEELEHISEIVPMRINASKVLDFLNAKKLKNKNTAY